jgi:hypothetical protein
VGVGLRGTGCGAGTGVVGGGAGGGGGGSAAGGADEWPGEEAELAGVTIEGVAVIGIVGIVWGL